MHHIEMKRRFLAFGVGLLILGGVFSLVAFVTNDARLSYAMGAILIFGGAIWLGATTKGDWWRRDFALRAACHRVCVLRVARVALLVAEFAALGPKCRDWRSLDGARATPRTHVGNLWGRPAPFYLFVVLQPLRAETDRTCDEPCVR